MVSNMSSGMDLESDVIHIERTIEKSGQRSASMKNTIPFPAQPGTRNKQR